MLRVETVARALEGLDVYWLEEPLHRADLEGMAALRWRSRLRIAGGEMAREVHELKLPIERGCLDVVQPDATLVGGLSGLARIARLAQGARPDLHAPHLGRRPRAYGQRPAGGRPRRVPLARVPPAIRPAGARSSATSS